MTTKEKIIEKSLKPIFHKWFYEMMFHHLMCLGMEDTNVPKKLLRSIDEVADYCGDAIHKRGIFAKPTQNKN